ncbi:MAG: hypothetical protein ABI047_01200 [Jatrophihabitantaceae bacterium]
MAAFDREIIMLKKIVLAASAAVVVLGVGTAALATSGSNSPSPSTSPSASGKPSSPNSAAAPDTAARGPKAHKPALRALGRALHAQWVTPDRDSENTFVTHNAIRGEVTAVSATSVTVKALDGVSQTYAITSDTKVHLRKNVPGQGQGKGPANGGMGNGGRGKGMSGGVAGSISDVHTGDKVAVTGTGTSNLTAQHIVDATE